MTPLYQAGTLGRTMSVCSLALQEWHINELPAHIQREQRYDMPVNPLYLQRRWARISRQYMHEYRKGADACEAIRAVTAQRTSPHLRHRDTSDPRCRRMEAEVSVLAAGM